MIRLANLESLNPVVQLVCVESTLKSYNTTVRLCAYHLP